MDIYGTAELNRVVTRLRPIPTFFLDTFFPEMVVSDSEEIYFDVVEDKPRLAPFVHPLKEGKVVESLGYSTKSFKPAYVKDKRVHNPLKAIKRRAGEAIGGSLSMEQRRQLNLAADLQDQRDMLTRRMEVMAAEAILSGKQTVKGDGIDAIVDFGRDAALIIALAGVAKWDDASKTNQSDDLENWSQLLLEKSGTGAGVVVMDIKAWKLFKRDAKFDKLLDRSYRGSTATIDMEPRFLAEGAQYKGQLGDFEVWVYSHPYIDPITGKLTNIMPDNTVVMVSMAVDGVRHFGAIMDEDNLRAQETFTKSWLQQDPSVRYLLMQSAPLMVTYRPNAALRVTVA